MTPYGLKEQRAKGHKYAEDDVCICLVNLNQGKHRSRRVKKHKRIFKKVARLQAKVMIRKEQQECFG